MTKINEDEEIRIIGGANWQPSAADGGNCQSKEKHPRKKSAFRWKLWGGILLAVVCLGFAGYYVYLQKYVYAVRFPLSRTQTEVIAALSEKRQPQTAGIEKTADTLLGVSLNFYKISGLQAQLAVGVPDLNDKNIYLVTRSADYWNKNGHEMIIGDYIVDGQEMARSSWRAGYFAILNGQVEIGVGRQPHLRDYLISEQGSMFRQFSLVSAGIKCVSQYLLKGKVTRCAYARMANNDLYYVETKYPETLYGFSDALIEYGFVDAVYITGGAQPDLFYRTANGESHGDFHDDKKHTMVVWKKSL